MAFAGIGDAATQVIKEQNQIGMQGASIAENARQFDISARQRRDQLAEQARQFDIQQAENARQFDVSQAEQAGRLAVSESAASARQRAQLAENARQFDIETARARQLDDFKMGLESLTASADLAGKDADTQMRIAQLKQYIAATADEDRRRKNRETMAKGAFGSLALSAIMNGGVMPTSAIELANRELGDKENVIIGGGVDDASGIAFFDVRGSDGSVKQLKMAPEKQYALLQDTYGAEVADMFSKRYSSNEAVMAAIERAKIAAEADMARATATADSRRLTTLVSQADSIGRRLADMEKMNPYAATTKEYEDLSRREKAYRAEIDKGLGMGGEEQAVQETPQQKLARITEPGSLKVREYVRQKLNLPENTEARIDPATGETVAAYKKGGKWVFLRLSE